jgi:adenylosuccinate lyase
MKDINEKALALGMNEATKLLNGQLERAASTASRWARCSPPSPDPQL